MEKRLEKLDVLESSSLAWLASTATKNGFTMESLYGMSHYYYRHCCHAACLASAAAAAAAAVAAAGAFPVSWSYTIAWTLLGDSRIYRRTFLLG